MCAVITLIGCALVGLVTRNFGSLSRYRVPFLPFYGALVLALNHAPAAARAKTAKAAPGGQAGSKRARAAAILAAARAQLAGGKGVGR
jgi:hypothetical protein